VVAQRVDPYGYRGDPAADIASVRDVANDQGGRLKLSWRASDLDQMYAPLIDHYAVDRWSGSAWTTLDSVFAAPLASYSMVIPTLSDSTGPSSPYTVLRVRAIGSGGAWTSASDSARSVDNLPPASVLLEGSYADGTAILRWNPVADADLAGYRIYRSTSGAAVPASSSLVTQIGTITYSDAFGVPAAYAVTSVDRHGNESPATTWTAPGFVPGREPLVTLALAAPYPNPAREGAVIAFRLPTIGAAELSICDLAGRIVRRLGGGTWAAGEHHLDWDVRDERGERVAAGAYFARLRARGISLTREIIVLR
jgi:hypothetical protein